MCVPTMSGYSVSINDFTSNVSVEPFILAQMELFFSETAPEWFSGREGQKMNLHMIWKTAVKQSLLPEGDLG